jgi:hypothetical protein
MSGSVLNSLQEVQQAVNDEVGFKLFTILVFRDSGKTMERIHSSHPEEYPVGGRKDVARDVAGDWLKACLEEQRPFFGRTAEDVARIFKDSELIASLGCGSIINAPILQDETTVAALNVLDAEGAYTDQDVEKILDIAKRSSTAILEAAGK